jgi:murein L,D-transpeptidase YafK
LCVSKNPDTLRGIDLLVPESFYYIAKFHPDNPYFIRMEINFPNESDRKRGRSGGDIAIHGGCFSTYCTPFTDKDIKEIYIFAAEAKTKGQKNIPVHNFPFRMTEENLQKFIKDKRYSSDIKRITNWQNMAY